MFVYVCRDKKKSNEWPFGCFCKWLKVRERDSKLCEEEERKICDKAFQACWVWFESHQKWRREKDCLCVWMECLWTDGEDLDVRLVCVCVNV